MEEGHPSQKYTVAALSVLEGVLQSGFAFWNAQHQGHQTVLDTKPLELGYLVQITCLPCNKTSPHLFRPDPKLWCHHLVDRTSLPLVRTEKLSGNSAQSQDGTTARVAKLKDLIQQKLVNGMVQAINLADHQIARAWAAYPWVLFFKECGKKGSKSFVLGAFTVILSTDIPLVMMPLPVQATLRCSDVEFKLPVYHFGKPIDGYFSLVVEETKISHPDLKRHTPKKSAPLDEVLQCFARNSVILTFPTFKITLPVLLPAKEWTASYTVCNTEPHRWDLFNSILNVIRIRITEEGQAPVDYPLKRDPAGPVVLSTQKNEKLIRHSPAYQQQPPATPQHQQVHHHSHSPHPHSPHPQLVAHAGPHHAHAHSQVPMPNHQLHPVPSHHSLSQLNQAVQPKIPLLLDSNEMTGSDTLSLSGSGRDLMGSRELVTSRELTNSRDFASNREIISRTEKMFDSQRESNRDLPKLDLPPGITIPKFEEFHEALLSQMPKGQADFRAAQMKRKPQNLELEKETPPLKKPHVDLKASGSPLEVPKTTTITNPTSIETSTSEPMDAEPVTAIVWTGQLHS